MRNVNRSRVNPADYITTRATASAYGALEGYEAALQTVRGADHPPTSPDDRRWLDWSEAEAITASHLGVPARWSRRFGRGFARGARRAIREWAGGGDLVSKRTSTTKEEPSMITIKDHTCSETSEIDASAPVIVCTVNPTGEHAISGIDADEATKNARDWGLHGLYSMTAGEWASGRFASEQAFVFDPGSPYVDTWWLSSLVLKGES